MLPTLLFLGLLASISATVSSTNPGLQIRFAQHGVDRAAQLVLDQVARDVQGFHFPDVSGSSDGFSYTISRMSITSFTKPTSRVEMTPGSGISWTTTGAGLRIHGFWRYDKRFFFFRLHDTGSFDMTGSGISLNISVRMGSDNQGRPTIQTTQCTSNIGSLTVNFHGSWLSFLYNLFREGIANAVKGLAEREMCTSAEKVINTVLNQQLAQLRVVNTIDNTFVFDYRLLRAPVVGRGYVQTMHKGEVRSRTNPVSFPSAPIPFLPPSGPTKMVYLWGSDYVVNSFAFAAFRKGLAQYNFSSKDLPANQQGFLVTSCPTSAICLGTLIPAVASMFPNRHVTMVLRAVRAPFITTTPRGINLTLPGEVSINVTSAAGQTDQILKVGLALNVSVNVSLDDRFVKGNIIDTKPQFTVLESVIPQISQYASALNEVYETFVEPFLLMKLNQLGQRGIEVPILQQVRFIRPEVKFNKGSVLVGTDIDWQSLVP